MDIGAYVQIKNLDEIAKANDIQVERLRGYRLMSEEKPLTRDEWLEVLTDAERNGFKDAFSVRPRFAIGDWIFKEYGMKTDRLMKRFQNSDGSIRWDRLHGKKRKAVKYYIRHRRKAALEQYRIYDKYAGMEGVLYIHARLGSGSWSDVKWWDYEKEPWFLCGCDDSFDKSYCDIYARIRVWNTPPNDQ